MTHQIPKIAVLLSTYNGAKFLDQQLYTLSQQKGVDITLFVRDDNSTDETLDILKSWNNKIKINLISSSQNMGPAKSFWYLIKNVELVFDYYALCDQDDIWDDDKLIIACKRIEAISNACLYFCAERTINSDGRLIDDGMTSNIILTLESEIVCGFCSGCAVVINNKLMRIVQKQNYTNLPMHDMVFILNAFVYGTVVYDTTPHFSRRIHQNNAVARGGKSNITLAKNYVKNMWKKNNCHLDSFIKEFLGNIDKNNKKRIELKELRLIANYKKRIKIKIMILNNTKFTSSNKRGLWSFRIRLIIGKL